MRVHYKTFGCKANQYDTERMRQLIEASGQVSDTKSPEAAELCVVNTCTVTNQADASARRFIRQVVRANPKLKVVVAGCSAALQGDIYRKMDEVQAVVEGHNPKQVAVAATQVTGQRLARAPHRSPANFASQLGGEAGQQLKHSPGPVQLGSELSLDRTHIEGLGASVLRRRAGATRGWLKVQDGCDRKCAFCATRLARGKSRSRPADQVVAEALALAKNHPELVITGVHIGHYGRDFQPRQTLTSLVRRLLDEVPGPRFRLGSIEATEIDDGMVDLLASAGGRLAPHLHMPLQSGADPVLRKMRRWHTREDYRRRVLQIAQVVSPIGLGADIITGFPGETDTDHRLTLDLVEELPFTYLHVFPYSPRDGTVAATLPKAVPERISRERGSQLRKLAAEKGTHHARSRGGSRAEVVLEGTGGTALTGDYLRVAVKDSCLPNPDALHLGQLNEDGSGIFLGTETAA